LTTLSNTLSALANAPNKAGIADLTRGLEKESLRIKPNGTLASSLHPKPLGSTLTHPHITTDYSEALVEFITEPCTDSTDTLQQLSELHAYTYQHLGDERLWPASMPCMLGRDSDIPIAQYGISNSGKMKSAYRMGLGHRYGRSMQTIAGLHYNFSVSEDLWRFLKSREGSDLSISDFKTQGYFRLIRNFRRYFWLLLYLFGASPGVCKSFVGNRPHQLEPFGEDIHSLHTPYATSLRMGDLGYQSNAQESLVITYNCLESYTKTLCSAITHTHPDYAAIGIKDNNGEHKQLNDSLLQIENEFYSVIRPKRTAQRGETALAALANGGVEYIEVRCLDLNPYEPLGINHQQMQFLDAFLLHCLLTDSPTSSHEEHIEIQNNQKRMVYQGRDPKLTLLDQGKERSMREWGEELIHEIEQVATLLDSASSKSASRENTPTDSRYCHSVAQERRKLHDASLTPSAKVLADMATQHKTFYRFAADLATEHQKYFMHYTLDETQHAYYSGLAQQSINKQHSIEDADTISFDRYLADYYLQYQCKAAVNTY
jgi:glutamate--cysteine ligase